MYMVIVDHVAKQGQYEAAVDRIDNNGDLMSVMPGFLARYRTRSNDNPDGLVVVTVWTDKKSYDDWIVKKKKIDEANGLSPTTSPYASAINKTYMVTKTHGNVPT